MKFRDLIPDLIDAVRDVELDPPRAKMVADALKRLAAEDDKPSDSRVDEARLARLLSAFDASEAAHGAASPSRAKLIVELSLAATVLIVAGVSVGWRSDAPERGASGNSATTAPALSMNAESAFMVLPGADALPRFEHGQVIQVDIPSAAGVVRAEVLIGQDGLARAARLVQ